MKDFFLAQMDFCFWIYGFSFVLLGAIVFSSLRRKNSLPWAYLGWFGILHGVNEWLDMLALDVLDNPAFKWVRVGVMVLSFVMLFEFGRRSAKFSGVNIRAEVYIPVVAVIVFLGFKFGLPGVNAGARYALGFGGSLLTALVLCREAVRGDKGVDWALVLVGVSFYFYAFFTGLIVPKAPFFLAMDLNQESFLALTGIPVQVFRAVCVLLAMAGVWLKGVIDKRQEQEVKVYAESWLMAPLFLAIFIAGFFLINWRASLVDRQMRARLMNTAVQIARTVNADDIKALSFTLEDKQRNQFQRLESQFIAFGEVTRLRSIYTMAMRNGRIVFGPENIPEGDAQASPPGTVYEQPRPEDLEAFKTKQAYTVGPVKDEYGNFVSAGAPVFDPRTGEVLVLVGIDLEAGRWNVDIAGERVMAIGVMSLFLLMVLAGHIIICQRRSGIVAAAWQRQREAVVVSVFGIFLTVLVGVNGYEQDVNGRYTILQGLANDRVALLRNNLNDVQDHHVPELVQVFMPGQPVSREAFHNGIGLASLLDWQAGFGWVPVVTSAGRQGYEEALSRELGETREIFSKDADGNKVRREERDEYLPLHYVEPFEEIKSAIGFDITSNPARWAAASTALRTGLMTSTGSVLRVSNGEKVINVYQRVRNDGVVYLTIRLEALLKGLALMSGAEEGTRFDLYQAETGKSPSWLASFGGKERPFDARTGQFWRDAVFHDFYPLMFFGKTYLLSIRSDDAVFMRQIRLQAFYTLLGGIAISLIGGFFTGFMINRQSDLEREINRRAKLLQASEGSYRRQFMDNCAPMLLVDSVDGHIMQANLAAAKFYGYPLAKLMAMKIGDINQLGHEKISEAMSEVFIKQGRMFEFKHLLADGSIRDVEVFASPIFLNDRAVIHSIIHDVTERKIVEREANKLMRAMEQSPVSVVITNVQGDIEYVNPKFVQVSGYSKEEVIGKNPRILKSGNIPAEVYQQLWTVILSGVEWKGELQNRRKNGEFYWEAVSIAVIKDADGKNIHFIAMKEDITARRAMESELRHSQAAAEAASKAKSDFLANMSHEIRTPMNAIIGFSDLMKQTDLDDRQKKYLDAVTSSGQLLLALINDILDISKIEAGKIDLESIDFDIEHLVSDLVQIVKPRAQGKPIELLVNIDPACHRWYKSDPTRIRQVILNLLSNAVKFTEKGEIVVTVSCRAVDGSGGRREMVAVSVKDTGIGIAEGNREFLFKPFSQADSSITRRYGGTGLGLAISRAITQRLGGDIEVRSVEGQGSEFVAIFEFEAVDDVHDGLGMASSAVFNGLKVGVVDDNEGARRLAANYCSRAGMDIVGLFVDAFEFLQWVRSGNQMPAVMIVDMMMPGMSGLEMIQELKASGRTGTTRFILLTSDARPGGAKEAKLAGFDAYLTKPVLNEELMNVIRAVLGDGDVKPIVTRHLAAEISLDGVEVLVAEDVEANWQLLQIYLETFGCVAERVADGMQVIEKLRLKRYDICLMDVQMPVLDGIRATEMIRRELKLDIPVVALTAAVMKEDRERAVAAGMNDVLHKPIDVNKLRNILLKWGKRGV
jgi:PAS domain S-box-containing protein